jgi:MFS transporter, MFS domain-containing protein family, molybdate-anion transporter
VNKNGESERPFFLSFSSFPVQFDWGVLSIKHCASEAPHASLGRAMLDFWIHFGVLFITTGAAWKALSGGVGDDSSSASADEIASLRKFRVSYISVYLMMMFADWLQGPYVYALYEWYGYSRTEIGHLFIAGFMSSMALGTFVGSLADKYGRRRLCIAFCVFYSCSCLTKLVNDYWVLMLGRILSGVATSLLFSVFEAWMVSEHNARGFSPSLLSGTFSMATFGNGIIAIVAGLVASFLADSYGFVAPFMLSLAVLVCGGVLVALTWSENYGDATQDVSGTFGKAIQDMKSDPRIPLLGTITSLFEASMYTFVFMWTPALQAGADPEDGTLPFGLIFACFMVAVMLGSTLFGAASEGHPLISRLTGTSGPIPVRNIGFVMLGVAACALAVPKFTQAQEPNFIAFLLFEIACGVYFPCFGTLRGMTLPESTRATVSNFFRVPLNFLVVVVLIKVGDFEVGTVFAICALWLTVAALLMQVFISLSAAAEASGSKATDDENRT